MRQMDREAWRRERRLWNEVQISYPTAKAGGLPATPRRPGFGAD